ncbi:multi-sensor signal transduction histidine kinase [Haloterrigena salina JCM 13891]|uniref:histidine kinase n=1 Tax=Haloterrigena salina JCM 13891 TaxID=1227488 RepID=M0BXZ1_9EURY|nr:PAS domain S-box protein [Haloterrigena salina]ELZ15283.1 multi-sensor signal transduction histidine kinase [Haloterrigena salina JCM 13891]
MGSETGVVYVCPAADGTVRELRERVDRVAAGDSVADLTAACSSADCAVVGDGSPDADPVECCRRLRTRWPDLPVIVFPADGSESLAGAVVAAGADGYVPRADGVDALASRIDALLADDGTEAPTADSTGSDSATALSSQLESLIDQSPFAMIEWSLEFDVVSWNPAATELFGYAASEARGRSATELIVPADIRDEIREHWEHLLDGEFDGNSAWRTDENVRKDGTTITCEWVNTPLTDDDGAVVSVLSFVRDVTAERKRANALEALQETTRELMRAESPDEIAAIVTDATEHVIDRPLAAVRIYDEDRGTLELAAVSESLDAVTSDISSIAPDEGVLWKTYAEGDPSVLEDVRSERLPYDLGIDVGNAVVHPLGDHGLLTVASADDVDLDIAEIHLVHVLAATAEVALDRATRQRELERTQTIVETVGDCVYQLDAEGRFVAVNDTMANTCNYGRDELVGEHISTVLTDESVERGRRRVRRLRSEDRRVATYEVTLVGRDGERTPAEVNMALLRSDGEIAGSVGIVRDISERKRMERELVERKAKIERLHEVASRLENCRSRREIYDCAVEAAEDVLNFDACVVKRLEGDHLITAALSSKLDAEFDRRMGIDEGIAGETYRTGETYRIDDLRTAPDAMPVDGTLRSVLSVPIGDRGVFQTVSTTVDSFGREDEELAELLLSHVTDALDRLAFEEQLRAERDRFAALFENVPDAVVSARQTAGDAIVEAVNPAFERTFGYEESAVVGRSLDQIIVPANRSTEAEALTRRGGDGETVETEVKRRTDDGLRDFMMRIVPVDRGESTDHTFGLYTDITDQKQRQKRVEILNRVLRHDMRNGMNIIDGCAEMLADAVGDDAIEYATTIQQRADELVSLAEKTRTVERVLECEPMTTGPTDVAQTIAATVDRLEAEYPAATVSCSVPDRLFVRIDASLETVLYQVLENAVEHHDGATPTIEVSVCDRSDDGMLSLSVADDGPGMPDEERELLQGDREITQLRHASGLGLWLVNLVVTQAGGQLSFDANEPRGTVVTLEIPRADTELVQPTGDETATGD